VEFCGISHKSALTVILEAIKLRLEESRGPLRRGGILHNNGFLYGLPFSFI
jgi:hypothetical protein